MIKTHNTQQPSLLALVGTVLLYMVVAETTAVPPPGQGLTQLFQPACGIALALLIVGGLRLAPAVFVGSLLSSLLAGYAPPAALAQALGAVTAACVSCVLLRRQVGFDRDHPNFKVVQQVLLWVCGAGAGAGALTASTALMLSGQIAPASWSGHLLQGTVFSAVLTTDGRLALGAVPRDTLYQALGSKLVALTATAEVDPATGTYSQRALGGARTPGALIDAFRFTL